MDEPGVVERERVAPLQRELVPLYALAAAVVCAAGSWYLLKELAPLLRPLTLAVFLAYTALPVHRRLSRRLPATLAGLFLALLAAVAVLGVAVLIYGNLVDLKAELPRLIDRGRGLVEGVRTWGRDHLPAWVFEPASTPTGPRRIRRRGSRLSPRPGQRRGGLPGRGPGRRVLPDLPADRSPVFPETGPGRVRPGTGRPRARGRRVDQPSHGLVPARRCSPAW